MFSSQSFHTNLTFEAPFPYNPGLRIRIRNVLPGSGSGIIIPDPDPTLEKKKIGRFNIFRLKEGGELTGNC